MQIKSIKKYVLGSLRCYGCGTGLELTSLKEVEYVGGDVVYVCEICCNRLSKICGIEVEEIDKPDITECARCSIRYKCFTTREKE